MAIVLIAAGYFFFLRGEKPAEKRTVVEPPSPEQQFQTLLSSSTVEAGKLSSLCSSRPDLAVKFLRGKQIRISGTVNQLRTSGIQGRRAELLLAGGGERGILLVCDLDQYSNPSVNLRYVGKFEAQGTELLYLVQRDRTFTKSVVITQGSNVSQFCALKSIGAVEVEFLMVNGPAWARAETAH